MRLIFLMLLLSVTSAESMLASGFFPLAAGNQWIYRVTGGGPSVAIVEVIGSRTQDSATYFQVRGFLPQDIWLRSGDDGNVFRFDPDARTESLLYAFGLGEGQDYQTSIHACDPSARIDSKPAHYEGPAGVFD